MTTTLSPVLQHWQSQIDAARMQGHVLQVQGAGTKGHLGCPAQGQPMVVTGWCGIQSYEPSELVITARSGTPLVDMEQQLAERGQYLPFEPPRTGRTGGTLGGAVAAGLSGPSRATRGSLRDHVLGVRMFNGLGHHLRFGGQVMKNVAGFDLSRVMVGSMGTLGVLTEVTLKVAPRPVGEITLCLPMPLPQAIQSVNAWAAQPVPLDACAWIDGQLYLRLRGARVAVDKVSRQWRQDHGASLWGDPSSGGQAWWDTLRDQQHPFFQLAPDQCLWRLSMPPTRDAPWPAAIEGDAWLVEWLGAQRWLKTSQDVATVMQAAHAMGGHAQLWQVGPGMPQAQQRAHAAQLGWQRLSAVQQRWHREIQRAFDPHGVFDTGRLTGQH